MKMAYISTIVSGVASLGVLLGLISGIFLLVLTGLRWVSRVRAALYDEELRRQKRLHGGNLYPLAEGTTHFGEIKGENGFDSRATSYGSFEPRTFQPQEYSDKKFYREAPAAANSNDGREDMKTDITKDTVHVRELIEQLVEAMVGSPLDGTTVGQLSTHSAYLSMFTKYHSLLCRELARLGFALHLSVVHGEGSDFDSGALKQLIKRIVLEAATLPSLKEVSSRSKTSKEAADNDIEKKSYEDILATAILNKVMENSQKGSEATDETSKCLSRIKSRYLMENEDCDVDGDQDFISNSDWSDSSHSEKLSLTIEEFIEEVTTTFEISDDERCEVSGLEKTGNRRVPFPESGRILRDVGTDDENSDMGEQSSATELFTSASSWEENWLFQKKRLRSTPNVHHPVPVPMLVPKPSEDFRALVGGVDAEDLSDISDCSDLALEGSVGAEEQYPEHLECLPHLPEADEGKEAPNSEIPAEVSTSEIPKAAPRACESGDQCNLKEAPGKHIPTGQTSPEILSQRDREYSVEDFHLVHQLGSGNSPTLSQRNEISEEDMKKDGDLPRCRIAEREKEKWKKAVPLPENPYSPENIEKREHRNKIDYFRTRAYVGDCIDFPDDLPVEETMASPRFSRDYYVNAAKHPSGIFSSSSLNQFSQGFKQDFSSGKVSPEQFNEIPCRNMQNKNNKGTTKTEFRLPNVKELAKQFTAEVRNQAPNEESESKHKQVPKNPVQKESKISPRHTVNDLPQRRHPKQEISDPLRPTTQMEIRRITKDDVIGNQAEVTRSKREEIRFNGKQVHSLTARSISKEFREGLKKNSCPKTYRKADRGSSGGESDQGDVVSNEMDASPAPSLDLKNIKKFWEEIITASSQPRKKD